MPNSADSGDENKGRTTTPPSPKEVKSNFIIDFIDHNGMRPIMALTVIAGAIWITINSDKICIIREPQSGNQPQVIRDNPVCSKYFEMTALVLGGLIGLAQPGISKQDKDKDK